MKAAADPNQWQHLQDLFTQALEIDGEQREQFVVDSCGGNIELETQLRILLAGDAAADEVFGGLSDETSDLFRSLDFVGRQVGRYLISKRIGSGGMGEVYLASDPDLDRLVALKLLPAALLDRETSRVRFAREAKAAARLSHPRIVTVYEIGEYEGVPFIAMEYVEGEPLHRYADRRSLSTDSIVKLTSLLCQGLEAAHTGGVIHRDIKPSNIIVDHEGQPRLLDFGLAVFVDSETLTRTGSTLGTVAYMSPEQIKGNKVDTRSDLFSLGVVIYELLFSSTPFRRDNIAATMKAILEDEPSFDSAHGPPVPDFLREIILRLLEKDVDRRYQSAADVAHDLEMRAAPVGLQEQSSPESRTDLPFKSIDSPENEPSADAQDYYERARGYYDDTREGLLNAEAMVKKAIALAPNFALAHALLGRIHVNQFWQYWDPSEERLESARVAIDRALELNENLPEARAALGWYYYHGRHNLDSAFHAFSRVVTMQPDNISAMSAMADIQARQGKWEESEASHRQLVRQDPRNVDSLMALGRFLAHLNKDQEAMRVYDQALDLAPDEGRIYRAKIWTHFHDDGDMVAARRILEQSEKSAGKWGELTRLHVQIDYIEGNFEQGLARMTEPPAVKDPISIEATDFYTLKAKGHEILGQHDQACQCLEMIREPLESLLDRRPKDQYLRSVLAQTYSGLGRHEEALQLAKEAIALLTVEEDHIDGVLTEVDLVKIYIHAGENDLALEQIERVLKMTSMWSPMFFRIWPSFIPLRKHPLFLELLDKYERKD